jgi:hypothetical protein
MYYTGKSNACTNALSRKAKEVKSQQMIIKQYCTQVFLPTDKINIKVLKDLKLDCLISQPSNSLPGQARKTADITIAKFIIAELKPE